MKASTRWTTLGSLILGILSACGCDTHNRTAAGCVNSLSLDLYSKDWPDGLYVVEANYTDGAGEPNRVQCAIDVPPRVDILPVAPPAPEMLEEENRCDQNVWFEVGKTLRLHFETAPSEIDLRVSRDGEELLNTRLEPEYDRYCPKGPECGGACRNGSVVVAM